MTNQTCKGLALTVVTAFLLVACSAKTPAALSTESSATNLNSNTATASPPDPVYLSDLWYFAGYGAGGNFALGHFSDSGDVLAAHGNTYPKGIWAHANSGAEYHLYGQYQSLQSDILLADWEVCGDGAVFSVVGDGKELYRSDVVTQADNPQHIQVDLNGVQVLNLETSIGPDNDMDCDWAIWGDPMLSPLALPVYDPPQPGQTEFYVSVNGDDSNTGTAEDPFATLERAQAAVRNVNQDMSSDIIVTVGQGEYLLDQPFYLDEMDSGSNGFQVTYQAKPNEQVVLSGGTPVTGWEPVDGSPLWQAPLAASDLRQLYVNGQRAQRAQLEAPIQGLRWVPGETEDKEGLVLSTGTVPSTSAENLEVHWVFEWMDIRLPIESLEETTATEQTLWFKEPYLSWAMFDQQLEQGWYRADFPFILENAFEFLDQPGEWYHDEGKGVVYYYPRPDEDMNSATIVYPTTHFLMAIQGTDTNHEAHDITIRGFEFNYNSWQRASQKGVFGWQSQSLIDNDNEYLSLALTPAAVEISSAYNITFEDNTLSHLGSAGLWLVNDVEDSAFVGNLFTDISDSAIVVGMPDHAYIDRANEAVTTDNLIKNNLITDVGVEYWGAPGISAFYTQGLEISHNELSDLPYTGISLGWGWSSEMESTTAGNNIVTANRIDNILTRARDGGGIYTLGQQPGTEISENYISGINDTEACLYPDGGSAFIEFAQNVCTNSPQWLFVPLYEVTPDGYDNFVVGNYTTTSNKEYHASTQESETTLFSLENPPEEAAQIMSQAGLEPAYQALRDR